MADNDHFRILVGGTGSNAGFAEIATADDATEPIYVRQYTGVFGTLVRTFTLLDGSGNTVIPQSLYIGGSTNGGRFYADDWGVKVGTDSGHIQFGPANSGTAHIYTNMPNFYFNKELLVLGSTVLHSGNYSSYALPLSGGSMTGLFISRTNTSSDTIGVATQGNPGIEVISNSASAAYMTFHRAGAYAVRFGFDTDNVLKVGGWSMGNVAYTIWHSGNLTNNNQLSNGSGYVTSSGVTSVATGTGLTGGTITTSGTISVLHATSTAQGGVRIRLSGTTLFIRTDGNNA